MDFFATTFRQVETFALILTRVTTLFLIAPVFGSRSIPGQVKLALGLVMSLILTGSAALITPERTATGLLQLGGSVFSEVLVGFALGYTAFLIFAGIQMAGQIVDIQMGFGLVNVVDPMSNAQVSILGQFYYLISILFFLTMDGHLVLLRALSESLALIPVGGLNSLAQGPNLGPLLARFFTQIFLIALQVAAPAVATLFLTTLAMGFLSRTIPQMNVFIVGLPLNVMVGLILTYATMKLIAVSLGGFVSGMAGNITRLISALAS